MSDDELIKRIRQGDNAATETLIRRYYPAVTRYCRWRCGSRETAEDLTQETFLRLFRSLSGYRQEGRFRAYLFAIANRLCTDESRRAVTDPWEDKAELLCARDENGRVEDRDELRAALERLPAEQREAVILRFGERLSFRDIAKATGCTLRTAQSRVAYGLKNMRRGMGDDD